MSIVVLDQNLQFIFYSVLSGFLPAFLWLWFWLREDIHPEPKKMIFKTFVAGMATIPVVLLVEYAFFSIFIKFNLTDPVNYSLFFIFVLAFTEEYFKYFAAKHTALNKKDFNEPVDALIYLITAALGFSAVENTMYILSGFKIKGIILGFVSGNFRFLGASLIHVISSAAIGAGIAFSLFHPMSHKNEENKGLLNEINKKILKRNIFFGFLTAVLLHSFFNYFIIKNGDNVFNVFLGVWILALIIIYIFEKLKNKFPTFSIKNKK